MTKGEVLQNTNIPKMTQSEHFTDGDRSQSPALERMKYTPSVKALQEVADLVKGRTTPRTHSIANSLTSKRADEEEFKSCNDDDPCDNKTTEECANTNSPVTVNRTWGAPSKCMALL